MKKVILLFATLVTFGQTAFAYDFSAVAPTGQTLYYNISDSGASVTYPGWYSSEDNSYYPSEYYTEPTGNLVIPSSVTVDGITYAVTSIGDRAFDGCSGLTSVSIPNTVIVIGLCSFQLCSGLTSVTIPSSVTTIDSYAFAGCSSLTSVTIPNSVTIAGTHVFGACDGLTSPVYNNTLFFKMPNFYGSYTIPSGITTICGGAFSGRSGMTAVTIPNSVTSIGSYAFRGCSSLTSVTIPNSVTSIGLSAFSSCSSLTSITIPNSVTNIENGTFQDCTSLTSVTFPTTVTSIESMAFSGCTGITEITSQPIVAPLLSSNAFDGVNNAIPINIPCGSSMSYYSRWSYFSNFVEDPAFQFEVASADETMGSVSVLTQPTCSAPTAVFNAIPNSGYRFDHWSDGNTENPRSLIVTSDTNIAAYFAAATSDTVYIYVHDTVYIHDTIYITSEGIGDVEAISAKIYQRDGQIVVEGANGNTVMFYDVNGRMLATKRDEYAPLRFDAPVSGTYMIKIGNHPARKMVVVR